MTDFRFTHEQVRGITTTDENGVETTYIAVTDLTGDMLQTLAAEQFKHTLIAMTAQQQAQDDPASVTDEALDSVEALYIIQGMTDAYSIMHRFTLHMDDVSKRLQAGQPAHASDEPDPEDVEKAVAEFAAALDGIEPEDFEA